MEKVAQMEIKDQIFFWREKKGVCGLKREPGTGRWFVPSDHAQRSCSRNASATLLRFLPLDREEQKGLDLSKTSLQNCTGGAMICGNSMWPFSSSSSGKPMSQPSIRVPTLTIILAFSESLRPQKKLYLA